MAKRVYIQNFGCQMNDYDVERMVEVLQKDGFDTADQPEDADLVLINSCSVREKAEQKMASAAGRYRELKQQRPQLVVAIGGCVATQEGERLLARAPTADFTFGPDQIPDLAQLLARFSESRQRFSATDFTDVESYRFLPAQPRSGTVGTTALVTIQKGCDNHCAFCVVPATRGPEVSRPADEVVAEVARFCQLGAREVTLIGQNVNSYHGIGAEDGDDFAELLARVDRVPGLLRLRFTTSHPKDFTPKVARAFATLPRLMPYLHLPVQSGSSRTLRRMVRDYTREEYLDKVDGLRALVPDVSLSTDIIVGYPGETDEDFAETMNLLERVEYDFIYSFGYSPRPDTPALKLKLRDDVPLAVKDARLQAVQALQARITQKRLNRFVGRTVEVLVEGRAERRNVAPSEAALSGRTPSNEMVSFCVPEAHAEQLIGTLERVRIVRASRHTLQAEWGQRKRLPMVESLKEDVQ
jgi:tRNA-2-methylthio-N6-dimethylallyladenosine synthase